MNEEKENLSNSGKKQFALRISKDLYTALTMWADDEFRSLNGQIEYILTDAVKKRRSSIDSKNESR
jgi:hypothetical protein